MWWLASLLSASLSCGIQSLYCSLSSNCTPDRMLLSASAQSCWLETQGCRKCLNCISKCVGVCICVFVCVRKSDRKGGRASCTGGRGGLLLRARFSWESWELRMWGLKRDASGLSMKACSAFAKEMIFLLFFFSPPCSNIYHSGSRQRKLLWLLSGANRVQRFFFIFFVAQNSPSLWAAAVTQRQGRQWSATSTALS